MIKKNWAKISTHIAFLALISFLIFSIYNIPVSEIFTEATKYFSYTLTFFLAFFIYFQYMKE